MKKFLVHLSVMCLLAALMVPMVGCKKEEPATDETATSDMGATAAPATDMAPPSTEMAPASTDMAPTGSDMAPASTDTAGKS